MSPQLIRRVGAAVTVGALGLLLGVLPALAQMTFTEVSALAGVTYQEQVPIPEPGCFFATLCGVESMTGSAAASDVDGDGDVDLFVTRLDASDILFVNQGNGTFVDGSAAAGFAALNTQSNGAAFADVDNDGDHDLMVIVIGENFDVVNNRNYLFINDGTGVFTEEAVARGVDDTDINERGGQSIGVGDYDGDGYLDFHVTDWLVSSPHQALFRNRGAAEPGVFDEVSVAAGVRDGLVRGFASTFVDLDDDGHTDLAVVGDFGTSRLYWNDGDGTFTDGTVAAGVGTDENGMGSTFGDFDRDGDLDWFITSIFDASETCVVQQCNWGYSGNRMFRNDGNRQFSDATDSAAVRDGYWGWGASFFDGDLDGDVDLVMTNGVDFPGTMVDNAWVSDPMRLWQNDGTGVMTEDSIASGVTDTGSGKGLLTFDYDSDGDLDVFVVNNAAGPKLYRNDTPRAGKSWLRLRVIGQAAASGHGAKVSVWTHSLAETPQVQRIGAGSHFHGHGDWVAHFGLGTGVTKVRRVLVELPDGSTYRYTDPTPDQEIVLDLDRMACGLLGLELLPVLFVHWARRRRK